MVFNVTYPPFKFTHPSNSLENRHMRIMIQSTRRRYGSTRNRCDTVEGKKYT